MRYLVADNSLQGLDPSDFNGGVEDGDMVIFTCPCKGTNLYPDIPCQCRIAFTTVFSARATTTVRVVEFDDWERATILENVQLHLERHWKLAPFWAQRAAPELVDEVERTAECFGLGAILEHEDDRVWQRRIG